MDNLNLDKNTMDKLNSMLNNGNLNDMLSQIPPDAIKNLSNMLNTNTNSSNDNSPSENAYTQKETVDNHSNNTNHFDNSNISNATNHSSNTNQFDFSNIDMNTILKMKTIMEKMNNSSAPRTNLLQSLKPYLRDEKKDKLDQYSQLLNMTSLIELFNQNNHKENTSDK